MDQHRHSTNFGKTIVRSPNHLYHFFLNKRMRNFYLRKNCNFYTNYLHCYTKMLNLPCLQDAKHQDLLNAKMLSLLFYSDYVDYIPSRSINSKCQAHNR